MKMSITNHSLALLVTTLTLAACSGPTEDVRLRVEGSHLVIENQSGADIRAQPVNVNQVRLDLDAPENLLRKGQTRKIRIKPSERGVEATVAWWRPGEKVDLEDLPTRGFLAMVSPKNLSGELVKLRSLAAHVPLLTEPLPTVEALILACVRASELEDALYPRMRHQRRVRSAVESGCIEFADENCATPGTSCQVNLDQMLADVARREEHLREKRGGARANVTAKAPIEGIARKAFGDLVGGNIDRYLSHLCPSAREAYAGPFMRGVLLEEGVDYARRKVQLAKVLSKEADRIVFLAPDESNVSGRTPMEASPQLRMRFGQDGARACLNELAMLR